MTTFPAEVHIVLADGKPLRTSATTQGAGQAVVEHVDVLLAKAGRNPTTVSEKEAIIARIVETGSLDLNQGSKRDEAVLGVERFTQISMFVQRRYEVQCHIIWP